MSVQYYEATLMKTPPHASASRSCLYALCLVVVCLLLFGWAVNFQFIELDDPTHVSRNPLMNPPSLANVGRFWTTIYFSMYIPVTYTIWSLAAKLAWTTQGGQPHLEPAVFHAFNVGLHTLNALLVFTVLSSLLGEMGDGGKEARDEGAATRAAFVGALVFAVHPVQVETVGWVSGLRDLSAVTFMLCATWCYVNSFTAGRNLRFVSGLALVAYLLGLLSIPTAAILPGVLFLCLDVGLRKLTSRVSLTRLWFWFPSGALALGFAKYFQPGTRLSYIPPYYCAPWSWAMLWHFTCTS